ncbi:FxsA family protein [Thiolinea disciformis]|uniref:FxsA family protein n=1 Tax=Thiolinea disciformis TaxID=125614 RepID=UPI00035CEC28|nr:FxsA family protein [Thiolinea disciformis]
MRKFPIIAVLLLLVPVLEIYLFVKVGGWIGFLPTIALLILMTFVGSYFVRHQGLSTLARIQKSMAQGQLPARDMLEGVLIVIGGILMMIPGFLSDILGILCILPPTRLAIAAALIPSVAARVQRSTFSASPFETSPQQPFNPINSSQSAHGQRGATIEGEFVRKD